MPHLRWWLCLLQSKSATYLEAFRGFQHPELSCDSPRIGIINHNLFCTYNPQRQFASSFGGYSIGYAHGFRYMLFKIKLLPFRDSRKLVFKVILAVLNW
ncbi:hypothetical protein B0J14DRAFT_73455 [Halenospora varia]|nr:hypothetical protein B0J14DRAFT_73455 [Halenospora varia]